jgi:eukaryotic-like serine/threonine-protein kinase
MTTFPAASDYYKAVQAPGQVFTVERLRRAEFAWDMIGPILARGSTAVVFQAMVGGSQQAVRCYIRNDASSRERYGALGAYLARHDLSPYVEGTTWLDGAIRVNGSTWPVLTMDWIDGRTLNEYVNALVKDSNTAALALLATRWRELVKLMQDVEFAHCDLQHGNIMVDQEGRLRLVDYDGVWIPQLAGMPVPTESGHPNYQHPALQNGWGRWFDTFSALVIYLSLVALSKDTGLWAELYTSKNLLFSQGDFSAPFDTPVWRLLAGIGDPEVATLARQLQQCCDPGWVSRQSLEKTLEQPVPLQQVAAPTRKLETRWWEAATLPAPPPLSDDPLDESGLTRPRPVVGPAGAARDEWWRAKGSPVPGSRQAPAPPAKPAKPTQQQQQQVAGGIALALGFIFTIAAIAEASHAIWLLIIGLPGIAWGLWRLISLSGKNTNNPGGPSGPSGPPGQT